MKYYDKCPSCGSRSYENIGSAAAHPAWGEGFFVADCVRCRAAFMSNTEASVQSLF